MIVNGHDHLYERFGKQDVDGRSDVRGIRQFIAGTGGAQLYDFMRITPNSQVRIRSHGILRLTLSPSAIRVGVRGRRRRRHGFGRRRLPLEMANLAI